MMMKMMMGDDAGDGPLLCGQYGRQQAFIEIQ